MVYWVRALLVNDVPADYDTAPVSFRTLAMGPPVGTAGAPTASDRAISADATISAFGTGATSATMRLEASTANDFATVVASADADATAGVAQTLIVSGLLPETTYYLRAVLVNDGGVQTVLDLGSATTTPAASPTVTLTIPDLASYHMTLVSVTTNGVAVEAAGGVYTVFSNATVVATFAAESSYRLTGEATVSIVMDGAHSRSDKARGQSERSEGFCPKVGHAHGVRPGRDIILLAEERRGDRRRRKRNADGELAQAEERSD